MDLGKTHIVVMWTVGPDEVAAGDAVFQSHGKWMEGHSREGDTALLDYSISKGPELANPVDPDSAPTGDTVFVLDEFYASPAGVVEHWRLARDTWHDLPAFMDWTARPRRSLRCTAERWFRASGNGSAPVLSAVARSLESPVAEPLGDLTGHDCPPVAHAAG